jgi:cellobiose-specific phosphotransferase system component IIC
LQPINYFILEILFLFKHPFLYLPFFEMWREMFFENLSSLFLEKGFATHDQKILEILFLFDHPFLYLPFFEMWREMFFENLSSLFL